MSDFYGLVSWVFLIAAVILLTGGGSEEPSIRDTIGVGCSFLALQAARAEGRAEK